MSQPYNVRDRTRRPVTTESSGDDHVAPADVPAVLSLIGGTPLVPLSQLSRSLSLGVSLHVKLEGLNPGGSVKDRTALFIIREAVREGKLSAGKTVLDATSGNTGIAYAMLGAALDFSVHLTLPADASPERMQILRAYGARLTLTDPSGGTEGARDFARQLAASEPDRYAYADQYNNPANVLAHYTTTGPEIWRQTEERITHFVAGLGTGGTMTGAGRYLKERNPDTHLIGVQPDGAQHGISGLKHLATAKAPGIYDARLVDRLVTVTTAEAEAMASRLAREEGLFVGISSGAAVAAALRVARGLEQGVVVALLADGGFKYASKRFWAD